jgi:hypothetical protein
MLTVRFAEEADLDGIVSLTTVYRGRLAEWSPKWWRKAATADRDHPGWLAHMVESPKFVFRVAKEDDRVVGCAVGFPQPGQCAIDDVALLDDGHWTTAGVVLLQAVDERPALTCTPSADSARLAGSWSAGLRPVSSYWIGAPKGRAVAVQPWDHRPVPQSPPHTFGATLNAEADGALCFADGDGIVVGSPSVSAPPVYEPGGTVCVIDRVVGSDRQRLLGSALAMVAERGDVLVNVVVGEDDDELAQLVQGCGLERTVDVLAWP